MPNFKLRSNEKELLDGEVSRADLYNNLKELELINKFLGGYRVLLRGLKRLLKGKEGATVKILDIASGGGGSLNIIFKTFSSKHNLKLYGVDLKKDCIDYALEHTHIQPIQFIYSDYRDLIDDPTKKYDITMTSLFCHHLEDEAIVVLLRWMKKNSNIGFIINDLHRHPLAFYSIKILSQIFSRCYLVKNDAPLSVLRSFTKKNLQHLLNRAGIENAEIRWLWAFRWLIIVRHK